MIFRGILVAVVVACIAITNVTDLQAQIVTFGPAIDIGVDPTDPGFISNDQSFIDTTGDLVLAVNLTDLDEGAATLVQNAVVNGVTFNEIGDAVDGEVAGDDIITFTDNGATVSITGDGTFRDDADSFNGSFGTFGFDSEVVELLDSAFLEVDSITFTDLTPGDEYLVQFIVNDDRNNNQNDTVTFTSGANSGTLDVINDGDGDVGLAIGETITATFTADADGTVVFTVDGTDDVVNAVQLRNITTTVPEPSSLALLGGLGLFMARRRRA